MGESCGTALWAALQVARDTRRSPTRCSSCSSRTRGRNYVGKLYSDDWLREQGLLGPDERPADYDWRATRPEVILRGAIPRG